MDCNYLDSHERDRSYTILAATGYNFCLLLRWLHALFCALVQATLRPCYCTQER